MNEVITKYAGSFVRTLLAAGAGFLVTKGVLSADTANHAADTLSSGLVEVIVGVVGWGVTLGWSFVQKKLAHTALQDAIAAPAGQATPTTTTNTAPKS